MNRTNVTRFFDSAKRLLADAFEGKIRVYCHFNESRKSRNYRYDTLFLSFLHHRSIFEYNSPGYDKCEINYFELVAQIAF